MPACETIRRRHRKVCIGDLDNIISLQNRNIKGLTNADVDFTEVFTANADVWAAIKTVSGKTIFDGANTEVNLTHEFIIVYDATVTAETWVEFDSRKFDIAKVEDLEERKEFMLLLCSERGVNTLDANYV